MKWVEIRRKAKELGSDGCTMALEFYRDCCLQHDIAYRTGKVSRRQADKEFRWCIQSKSKFGIWPPMAWWRWAAVRIGGRKAYKG